MSRIAKKVRSSKPVSGDFLLEQARVQWAGGKLAECARILDRILAAHPDHAEALHLRGAVTTSEGHAREAVEFFSRAARIVPDNDDYLCDLGTALHAQQRAREAEEVYRRILNRAPDHAASLFNLANLLREQTRLPEALQCYTRLLEHTPNHPAWNNLGFTLLEMGHQDEALNCFAQALRVNPQDVLALANVALIEQERGQLTSAVHTLEQALAIDPRNPELHLNLGNLLVTHGRTIDGLRHLRRAIEISPAHSAARSAVICALDYDSATTTADQQGARKEWYKTCVRPRAVVALDHYRHPDPDRKLRIGYVSADFRFTSAAMAFFPMLHDYDRNGFEVYCYSNNLQEDAVTAAIRGQVAQFRVIAGMSDADAAARITADGIDILMDLSGHMKGHRLGVFAHRPAPLQGTAWGYTNGTGMEEIDFMFADPVFVTADDARHFSERVIDLPSVIPYQPLDALPPLTESPAATRGEITFGCYSRLQKITEATIDLWAKVLLAVPRANLALKAAQNAEPAVLQDLLGKFAARGIDGARLRFLPHSGWREHMESFSQIDIQLDPFPHGGGVSLLDGIAMGVPSLTLLGRTPPSRLGAALLTAIGLEADWMARSEEDYVTRAAQLAGDIQVLRSQRAVLRDRLLRSRVGNVQEYVRCAETEYRGLWRNRCLSLVKERDSRLARVHQALAGGRGSDCEPLLSSLLAAGSDDYVAHHYAGLAAYQTGRPATAIEQLKIATELAPDYMDAWIDLGTVLTTHGHLDEAMRVLETVVAKHPLNFLAQSNLGIVLFQAERVAEAKHALETAHRINPQHAGVLGNMGIIRERLGDSEAAAECYRQSVKCDPGFALGHASLGRLAAGCGDELAALDHFERALRSTPTLRWLRYELAVLYLKQGKRDALGRLIGELDAAGNLETEKLPDTVSDAFVAITSLLMAKPDLAVPDRERLCSDLMPLAGRLKTLNDPAKLTLLEQMITLNPANLNVYLQLGIAHHHDGQYAPAAKVWLEGLRKRDELAGTAGLLDYPHRVLDGTWTLAVGHLQLFDPYLKSVQLGLRPARTLWLLQTDQHPVPNGSYLDYWRPFIRTMEGSGDGSNLLPTAKAVGLEPSLLPLVTDHFFADRIPGVHEMWHMEFAASVQRRWEQERRPPLLQLTAGDREFGAATLNKMGVPADAWYVCVHVRESGFWGQWDRYHASIRNADIDTYRVAMEEIVSRGGWVIRMGDDSMRPIAPMRQVVDYAHSEFKSERMDVFLCATARLFVGVNSGPSLLPPTFGGRCLLTNFVPLSVPFPYGADRMLPKRYRSRIDGHLLDLDEMFTTGAAHFYSESHLPDWLEVVDNSAEEIAEGVMEMLDGPDDRLPAEEVQEFDALRRRYDAIVLGHGGFTGTPVGGRYLRRYAGLLGSARTIVHESPWPVVSPHPVIQQQCGSSAP